MSVLVFFFVKIHYNDTMQQQTTIINVVWMGSLCLSLRACLNNHVPNVSGVGTIQRVNNCRYSYNNDKQLIAAYFLQFDRMQAASEKEC